MITGFSIVSLADKNAWALFVHPAYEGKGIGKKLQELMLDWYFSKTTDTIWLGTAPHTRAEQFYRHTGWKENGMHGKQEIKFEMNYADWKRRSEMQHHG